MALAFLVIALIAAVFGFGLIASLTFDAARILFVVFLVLSAVAFIANVARSRPIDTV